MYTRSVLAPNKSSMSEWCRQSPGDIGDTGLSFPARVERLALGLSFPARVEQAFRLGLSAWR